MAMSELPTLSTTAVPPTHMQARSTSLELIENDWSSSRPSPWSSRSSIQPRAKNTKPMASTPPISPWTKPSSMNGTRMNQLVAPTSFITSISRRRANMAVRMVLRMSRVEASSKKTAEDEQALVDEVGHALHLLDHVGGGADLEDVGLLAVVVDQALDGLDAGVLGADPEAGGQVRCPHVLQHRVLALEELLEVGVGLVAVDVGGLGDAGVLLERAADLGQLGVGDVGLDVDDELDPVLELAGQVLGALADQHRGADDGERDEHGEHGRDGERDVPREVRAGLAEDVVAVDGHGGASLPYS